MFAKYGEGKLFFDVKHAIMFSSQYMFCEGTVEVHMDDIHTMLVMSVSYLYRRFANIEFGTFITLVLIDNMCGAAVVFWFK